MVIEHYVFAAAGAFALYFFGPAAGQDFLDRRFPRWPAGLFKDVCAIILYVGIGAIVATTLMDPKDSRQALLAGFSWVGLLEVTKGR